MRRFPSPVFYRMLAFALAPLALAHCANTGRLSCAYPDVAAAIETLSPSLAYPEAGATGVPTNIGTVLYYFSTSALPLKLQSGSMQLATVPGVVPSPLPSPIATPQFMGQALSARAVGTLAPNTSYAITYRYSVTSGCPMMTTNRTATLGTFTTQ